MPVISPPRFAWLQIVTTVLSHLYAAKKANFVAIFEMIDLLIIYWLKKIVFFLSLVSTRSAMFLDCLICDFRSIIDCVTFMTFCDSTGPGKFREIVDDLEWILF